VVVMMSTGLLMWFMGLPPLISRTSAIFVRDILAWAITIVVLRHMRKAQPGRGPFPRQRRPHPDVAAAARRRQAAMEELAADAPDETRSSFRHERDRDHRGHVRVETELRTHRQRGVFIEHLVGKGADSSRCRPLEVCSVSNRRPPDRGSGARHFA